MAWSRWLLFCLLEKYGEAWSKCDTLGDLRNVVSFCCEIHSSALKFLLLRSSSRRLNAYLMGVALTWCAIWRVCWVTTLSTAACTIVWGTTWALNFGVHPTLRLALLGQVLFFAVSMMLVVCLLISPVHPSSLIELILLVCSLMTLMINLRRRWKIGTLRNLWFLGGTQVLKNVM